MSKRTPTPTDGYCVYCTTHKDGRFYVGKAITTKVQNGTYKGSGVKIGNALKKDWGAWSTVILEKGLSNLQALALEKSLVDDEMLANPLCMNLMRGGGRKEDGCPLYQLSRGEKISLAKKARFLRDPALKDRYKGYLKKGSDLARKKFAGIEFSFTFNGVSFSAGSLGELDALALKHGLVLERVSAKTYTASYRYSVDGVGVPSKEAAYQKLRELECDFISVPGEKGKVDLRVVEGTPGWYNWTRFGRAPKAVKYLDGVKYKKLFELYAIARKQNMNLVKTGTNTYTMVPKRKLTP